MAHILYLIVLIAARNLRPEVIICDIGLPHGMSGFDFAKQFRQDQSMRNAYLIAMTGYGQNEDKRRASEAGFHCHLTKPANLMDIKRVLSEEIRTWRIAKTSV